MNSCTMNYSNRMEPKLTERDKTELTNGTVINAKADLSSTFGRGKLHTNFTFSIVDAANLKRFIRINSEKSEFCISAQSEHKAS